MCSNLYKVLPGEISVFIYRLISLFLFDFFLYYGNDLIH